MADSSGKPDHFERMVLTGPPPPTPHLVQLAKALVDRATLKFRDFRVDCESIGAAAIAAMKAGDFPKGDAQLIFLDTGDVVSKPLVQRYLDAQEFELVARFLKHRIMYSPTGWLSERNRLALDGMIAGGETPMAVALLREFLKKLHGHTQEQWRAAGRKAPKGTNDAETLEAFDRMRKDALCELPAHLKIAELEMAEIETYLAEYGSREDNRALEKFRAEIAKVRKRFNIGD